MVDSDIDLLAIADTVRRLPNMTDIDNLMKLLVAANYDAPTSIAAE
ncbi:MAG: hypothetical protein VX090_17730 [Pseudomonadota bacterium]|nr:hypothetical protein [Pseudomonadota bacterium]MEC8699396.1 hypothetical protein [Pseudomonadota bacterium]